MQKEGEDPRVRILLAMDTQGMRKVLRLYRALSGQGGRLFRAREDNRAELGALLAPLRKLGLLEGPEDNSKFILCHDPHTVVHLWDKLTAAAQQPRPGQAAELSAFLARMDTQRLPPPGEGEKGRETDVVTLRNGGRKSKNKKRGPAKSTPVRKETLCKASQRGFKLMRYMYPVQEGRSGLECLTEAAASMSNSDEEERSTSDNTPPENPPAPPGPTMGVVRRWSLFQPVPSANAPATEEPSRPVARSQEEPPAPSAPATEEPSRPVTRSQEEPPAPSAPATEEPSRPVTRSQEEPPAPCAAACRKRPATPEEDEDAPVTKQRARDRAADRGTRTPPQTPGNGQDRVEASLPLDGARGSPPAARSDPERSDERARELTEHQQVVFSTLVEIAGQKNRKQCETFVREMHEFTCKEDVLQRLRALRLPSMAIMSQLERDVLVAITKAARRGDKVMRLARWLVDKQRCGIPVFMASVERLLDMAEHKTGSEFVDILRRAVAADSAPHVLRRLLESAHVVFASLPPMNQFF